MVPFIGEVRIFSFGFAPKGWAFCDGATLQINQNPALYSLLGTQFGGDGRVTFGLPDLRGRVAPAFDGGAYQMGGTGGEAAHTIVASEMPGPHTHVAQGLTDTATTNLAANALLANVPTANAYSKVNPPQPLAPGTITATGGAAHDNMSPFLALTFCIALQGVFPSRN